jgi:Helix-turn-helix domain
MTFDKKKRPRRIASDEALSWARNLRLKNVHAKIILMMLSLYVDGDGVAWVSAMALAEDCELSDDTVRRRITWLAEIGAIARLPQWIDENGRRNGEGRGKRTTDLVRLLYDGDADEIEARAVGKYGGGSTAADPEPPVEELNDESVSLRYQRQNETSLASAACPPPAAVDPVSPRLASAQPPHCSGLHIDEPEPEPEKTPPSPPPGGVRANENDEVKEVEHFPEFWQAYPGHAVMSRYRALEIFNAMTPAERAHARAAALPHAEELAKLKRRPRDAHKWLAEKGWQEYPHAKLQSPNAASQRRIIKRNELKVVTLALKIAGQRPPSLVNTVSEEDNRRTDGTFWGRPVDADLLAMAKFSDDGEIGWQPVIEGSPNFRAWHDRLTEWVGICEPQKIWQEPFDPQVHGIPGSDPAFKPRKFAMGLRVPSPWPPSVDGKKLYTETTGPPETLMTEQDMADGFK